MIALFGALQLLFSGDNEMNAVSEARQMVLQSLKETIS
jgi:hypothetical protein